MKGSKEAGMRGFKGERRREEKSYVCDSVMTIRFLVFFYKEDIGGVKFFLYIRTKEV